MKALGFIHTLFISNVFNFGSSLMFLDCLNDLFVCVPLLHIEISILLD